MKWLASAVGNFVGGVLWNAFRLVLYLVVVGFLLSITKSESATIVVMVLLAGALEIALKLRAKNSAPTE